MVQQLTIFDAVPKKEAFDVGDTVEVVVNVEEKDVEDYYYLKVFEGMKGRIVKVLPRRQYEVLFAKSNLDNPYEKTDVSLKVRTDKANGWEAHASWADKLANSTLTDADVLGLAVKYTVAVNK